jgi:carotenoid cleavage dioxygenase
MTVGLLLAFLPWILFYLLPLHTLIQLKIGIGALLLLAILTNFQGLKRKFILPWCTVLFFAFIFLGLVVFNLKSLALYLGVFTHIALTILAFGSLVVGIPFTIQYARLEVPKEKWHDPIFIFINQVLTFVWGISFLINLILNIIYKIYPFSNIILAILANTMTLCAILFTLWFPKWYRKRVIGIKP